MMIEWMTVSAIERLTHEGLEERFRRGLGV
jgi:hypothetical protein